jgi:inorganic pyrophosphatase
MARRSNPSPPAGGVPPLSAWDHPTGLLNVLVDTPQGSTVKYKLDPRHHVYTISHVLPGDAAFPFDFGSIPSTLAADGDPLDVLVLMEVPSFTGCLVRGRLLGALEAKQTQKGKTQRNDRLIAVAAESRDYRGARRLTDLRPRLLDEIEEFFVSYNARRGRRFRILRRVGRTAARKLVDAGERRFRKTHEADSPSRRRS